MGGSEGPSDEEPNVAAPAGIIHDILMPKLGETVTEGTVSAWIKKAGDTVEMDDSLFEMSTDNVDSEIPSPYDGVLLEILIGEGETVPVGTPLARIGEAGTHVPAGVAKGPANAAASAAAAPASPVAPGAVGGAVPGPVSYTHLRAHETDSYIVCRL